MRVVAAVEGSEGSLAAVRYVIQFARGIPGIDIDLVNVQVPIDSAYIRRFVTQEMIENFHRTEADKALEPAAAILDAARVKYRRVAKVGHVAETIAQHGASCDRIVMGSRGAGAVADLVLGSTAARVLHLAGVPVTLVK